MSFIVDDYGFAEALQDVDACRWAMFRGQKIYNSLADAVHLGGVIATPFREPISTKTRYDCFRALGIGDRTSGDRSVEPELVAVGLCAVYEVHGRARTKTRRRQDVEVRINEGVPIGASAIGAATTNF